MSRPTTKLLLAFATTILCLGAGAGTALAHDETGTMSITRAEQSGPTSVLVEVGIVFAGDGHLAEDATVSATLDDGTTSVGSIPLQHGEAGTSLYSATIDVPSAGTWAIEVTSTDPNASATGSVTVSDSPAPTTTASTTTTTTTEDQTAEQPTSAPPGGSDDITPLTAANQDDGGVSPTVVIVACLVLAAAVIGGAFLVARQRSRKDANRE